VDAVRLGSVLRAVRVRRGWRQADVAERAGVSVSTVSRIERGRVAGTAVGVLLRTAAVLEVRVEWSAWWRGGELDRMLNAGHAAMHEAVARVLDAAGWSLAPESTFSIYGERGVIDVLAFHEPTRALLVVELKTQLVDVQALIGAVDRYRRVAPIVARERGWVARGVSSWVVLRDTRTNRRRLSDHATVLRAAFPDDGRRIRTWVARPAHRIRALSFLPDSPHLTASAASAGVQRVRRRSRA
jgi:transcriptional regulator with XRE-family HTH domain